MPKRAFDITVVIQNNDDAPAPHEGDVLTLLLHRNFEVVETVTSDGGKPIITIREVPKG